MMDRKQRKGKRSILAMMTVAATLLAAPVAVAQTQEETPNEQQKRTQAHHESWGPGQGLTLVGEVVSWDDESLRVKTTTGTENVVLTEQTRMNVNLAKGMKVAVDYNRSTQGAIIADQVRVGDVKGIDKAEGAGMVDVRQLDPNVYLVGTVTRFDDDSLVLLTDDGERSVVLTPVTRRSFVYKVGDPVVVRYDRDAQNKNRMMAQEVMRPEETANREQMRTRAHAESWGPGQGLTMVGEVVSVDDDTLVVKTTTGAEHIVLTQDTEMMVEDLEKGDRVAVDYVRNTQGAIIADQVRDGSQVRMPDEGGR